MALRSLFDRRAISPQTLFRTGADTLDFNTTYAGVSVTADSALTYSGVWACVRLLSGDIARLPIHAYRQDGPSRMLLDRQPAWLETPDPDDPSITANDHFGQVALSLLLDGNAFVLVSPNVLIPERLQVLNPRRVEVRKPGRSPEYYLIDANGRRSPVTLGPMDIIHVKLNAKPGANRGMSPIDVNSGSIGISLAAQKWVENWFGRGTQAPGFIEVMPETTNEQVAQMRDELAKNNGGWRKSGILGFLRGSKFTATGISPKDADLTNIFRNQLEEGARIYGIPPFMVGSQEPAGVAYNSSVERAQHYIDHCLIHYIDPIERAYKRLVPGDQRLMTPGSDTYVKFNLDALLRGDPTTRASFYKGLWELGALNADTVRAFEELPPIPDGLGKTYYYPSANYSPVGTQPAPAAPPPTPTPAA